MTIIGRLLTLMICFEFILAPMKLSLLKINTAQADDRCPTPGTTWSENTNRCLTTTEQAELRNKLDQCKNKTGDERRQCLENNVTNSGNTSFNSSNVNNPNSIGLTKTDASAGDVITGGDGVSGVTRGAALIVPLFFMTTTLTDPSRKLTDCTPASLMLLYGGSLVLLAGEVITYFTHTGALRKLETDWKEKSKQDETGKVALKDTQSEAFGFLAANEGVKKDTSTYKAAYYAGSAALFAAGAVAAIVEMVQLGQAEAMAKIPQTAAAGQQEINRITCATTKIPEEQKPKEAKESSPDEWNQLPAKDGPPPMPANEPGVAAPSESGPPSLPPLLEAAPSASAPAPAPATGGGSAETRDIPVQPGQKSLWHSTKPGEKADYFKSMDKSDHLFKNPFAKEIDSIHHQKIKTIAIKNIATATDSFNLVELLSELKNIEFENYSKNSYLPLDENTKILKESKLTSDVSKVISEILLIKEAHAILDDSGTYDPDSFGSTTPPDSIPTPPRAKPTVDAANEAERQRLEAERKRLEAIAEANDPNKGAAKPQDSGLGDIASKIPQAGQMIKDVVKGGPMVKKEDVKAAEGEASSAFSNTVHQPWFRLVVNGVMGTWTGVVTGFLVDQANKYAKRQELLNSMKDSFNSVSGIMDCSDDDRNNPSKSNCYCFTSDSKRNEARSNSNVCKALFGTGPNYGSTDYTHLSQTPTCVNKNQAVDSKCSCKQTNSCARVAVTNGAGVNISPGTFRTIGMGTGLGNDLLGGKTSAGNVNIGSALSNASRIRAAAMKALTPAQTKKFEAASAKLEKSLLDATKNMSMPSAGSALGNSDLSKMTPAQAAATLQKEFKDNKEKNKDVVAAPTYGQPGTAKEQLEFGMTQADLAAQETEVAEVMKQKLDFNQNDINSGSKQNIFEVLSNRYQRSGMRRLFDESGKTKADKANADDINK